MGSEEEEAVGYRSAKPAEALTSHNRPHGKSHLAETSFNFVHTVTTISYTPPQPTFNTLYIHTI